MYNDILKRYKRKVAALDFYLEAYDIPNELNLFEKVVQKNSKIFGSDSGFYWYYEDEKSQSKHERVIHSHIAEDYLLNKGFLQKLPGSQQTSLQALRNIERPLVFYNMECLLTRYVIVDNMHPLRINTYKRNIVSFIQGPYFVSHLSHPEESMYFSNFTKLLIDRKYERRDIDRIIDKSDTSIILSVLGMWSKLCSLELSDISAKNQNKFVVRQSITFRCSLSPLSWITLCIRG